MNIYPIVVRELRAQSRQPMTYWVRPLALAAALVAVALVDMDGGLQLQQGGRVFTLLHRILFYTIWICAPLLTADCLSRERREETLGLLFLTPLRAWEVAAAKGLTQGLRSATLMFAVAPALAVPILLGGVTWQHVAFSAVILSVSLVLALSAGLLASSYCRARNRALILALLLAGAALLAETVLTGFLLYAELSVFQNNRENPSFALFTQIGWLTLQNERYLFWNELLRLQQPASLGLNAALAIGMSLTAFGAAIVLAASTLRRTLREKPKSQIRLGLEDFFFAPAYAVGFYYRWLKRGLEKNPIGWLEKRRWSGRLATWAWLAVGAVFLLGAITHADIIGDRDGWNVIKFFLFVMTGHMAVMAAGSFGRERANGVMELLLITPMSAAQIISGRLRGIWAQFLPGALVMVVAGLIAWLVMHFRDHGALHQHYYRGRIRPDQVSLVYLVATFTMLPVIGLYYSLRIRFFLAALLVTLLVGLVIPWVVTGYGASRMVVFFRGNYGYYNMDAWAQAGAHFWVLHWLFFQGGLPTLWLMGMGLFLLHRLHRRLVQRKFSYQTG